MDMELGGPRIFKPSCGPDAARWIHVNDLVKEKLPAVQQESDDDRPARWLDQVPDLCVSAERTIIPTDRNFNIPGPKSPRSE